jgi:hypothetical protein
MTRTKYYKYYNQVSFIIDSPPSFIDDFPSNPISVLFPGLLPYIRYAIVGRSRDHSTHERQLRCYVQLEKRKFTETRLREYLPGVNFNAPDGTERQHWATEQSDFCRMQDILPYEHGTLTTGEMMKR